MGGSGNFFDRIEKENAERLGLTVEELNSMIISEIESSMDLDNTDNIVTDSLALTYPRTKFGQV